MAQATIDTTVTGLQGVPVAANTPAVNQALVFNGTSWVPTTQNFLPLSGGTITGQLSVAASGSINSAGPATVSSLGVNGQSVLTGQTFINTTGAGLGAVTPNPAARIAAPSGSPSLVIDGWNYPSVIMRGAYGTPAAPQSIPSGGVIGSLQFYGSTAPGTYQTSASISLSAIAVETWSATAQGSDLQIWVTPAGQTAAAAVQIADMRATLINMLTNFQVSLPVNGGVSIWSQLSNDTPVTWNVNGVRTWGLIGQTSNGAFTIRDMTASTGTAGNRLTVVTDGDTYCSGACQSVWSTPLQGNNSGYCGSPTQAWASVNAYAINNLSDPRDKRDVTPAPSGALAKVKAISVINYRTIIPPEPRTPDANTSHRRPDYDQLRIGFDVTEVRKVHPDAVTMDDEGVHPRAYSLSDMNAILWKAVQELTAKVEALEGRR